MPRRYLLPAFLVISCLITSFLSQPAFAAEPLHYKFTDTPSPIYEITIQTQTPTSVETISGHIFYSIKSIDPVNGQIKLSYSMQFHPVEKKARALDDASALPPMPPAGPVTFPYPSPQNSAELMISPLGKVIHAAGQSEQLPESLGLVWQLMLQPLPADNQTTWTTQRPVSLYEKSTPQPGQRTDQTTEISAQETVTYTVGAADDKTTTIGRKIELETDEKVGDAPLERLVGQGQYVFDNNAGLIQSLELKQAIEVNRSNMTVRIPAIVKARLLTTEEVTKAKADQEAALAKAKDSQDKFRSQIAAEHANDANDIPEGSSKTEMVGGNGGGPYIKLSKEKHDVIGFTIKLGSWAGHPVLGHVEPLYETPADMKPENATVCLAKDGYVVGGIIVSEKDGAAGMRVIFMKKAGAGVDVKASYMSAWFGYSQGTMHTLAGNGERVIGTFGRQGMNMDALGLVVDPPAAGNADVLKS